jgi:hypothetical protein
MALDGTYSGLQASVSDFLNRTDLAAVVPDFITIATAQMTRRLIKDGPVRQMLGTWSTTFSAELTNLPADFMGVKSLYLAGTTTVFEINFVEPEKIAEFKLKFPNMDGDPQFYSIVGNQIQFWPWAGTGSYAGTVLYWQALPALSNSNTTNWLLTLYPDAYLYTALIQTAPYLKDDERLQTWGTLSSTILSDIVETDKVARMAPHLGVPLLTSTP